MKKLDQLIKKGGITLFIIIGIQWAVSAQTTLTGRLTDENSAEPVPGAIIQVKGTGSGTSTDIDGYYVLKVDSLPATLVVSSMGFITREIILPVGTTTATPLDIALIVDSEEIVVVGYGVQAKTDLVGAVSKVDPTDIKTIPTGSFDAQLQGKATGVQVATNSGVPGSDVFMRVRGATSINASNDPLYVIDGVFVNNQSCRIQLLLVLLRKEQRHP